MVGDVCVIIGVSWCFGYWCVGCLFVVFVVDVGYIGVYYIVVVLFVVDVECVVGGGWCVWFC